MEPANTTVHGAATSTFFPQRNEDDRNRSEVLEVKLLIKCPRFQLWRLSGYITHGIRQNAPKISKLVHFVIGLAL